MVRHTENNCLFLTEGEVAAKVGMTSLEWQAAAIVLERSGLPAKDPLFGNQRYWPTVQAYLDRRAGLGQSAFTPIVDGVENRENDRRKTRSSPKTAKDQASG